MKHPLGICSWSLHNDLNNVTQALQETGLSHLHLDVSAVEGFRDAIAQNGWVVTSTMVSFPQEDYSSLDSIRETGGIVPDACWEENRGLVVDAIKLTSELGVRFLSTHVGFIDHTDAEGYARFCLRMRELCDVAQAHDVALLMETGQETANDLRRCLEELDHPALGVNFDPANMILYGKGDPVAAVHVLAPWIRHVHIKDACACTQPGEWGTEVPWGEGEVPHADFLQSLNHIGYTGALAVEREAGDQRALDILEAVQQLRKGSP